MHFSEGLDDKKADGAFVSKGCSFNLQDMEYYIIRKFKMNLQEAVFYKEAFREELRTQKLKVAKLEEQNLEVLEIRQELKDSRTMVHAKDVETQKFGTQLREY